MDAAAADDDAALDIPGYDRIADDDIMVEN